MEEIWKDIKGYEGLYQVSNTGKIKSFRKSTKFHCASEYFLSPSIINSGYYTVTLYKSNQKHKFQVHRLVAEHFLENPNNYPCVNHKDENKLNNCADNLEWCTYAYNNTYGTIKDGKLITLAKPINQYTLTGVWVATYLSPSIAAKMLNISVVSIRNCCNGKQDSAHGYLWKYV